MADRPILMSAPPVRATLDGRKTQTRRLAWEAKEPEKPRRGDVLRTENGKGWHLRPTVWQKAEPGDRLWVRETFYETDKISRIGLIDGKPCPVVFRADWPEDEWRFAKWTPSIFMPREFSRLTLVVTDVRMERLQTISTNDCYEEGAADRPKLLHLGSEVTVRQNAVREFRQLWNSLHGADAWDANPEVVPLTFTSHQKNIDMMAEAA